MNIFLAPLLGCPWESPITHLCYRGPFGGLCTAVFVSVNENTEATGIMRPHIPHPVNLLAHKNHKEENESWNLLFESFEF
jgi:hypothetical protein